MFAMFSQAVLGQGVSHSAAIDGLSELWRVGDSQDDVLFGEIADVASDSEGNVYVADWMHPAVYVVSDGGVDVSEIGGKGQGPGEFVSIRNVFVGEGDSLFVYDNEVDRISLFSPGDRSFAGSLRIETGDKYSPSSLIGVVSKGYVVSYVHVLDDGVDNQANRVRIVHLVDRITGASSTTSPITRIKNLGVLVHSSRDGSHAMISNPFYVTPRMYVSTQGKMYFSRGDRRVIAVHDESGQFSDSLRWDQDLIPTNSKASRNKVNEYSRRWRRVMREVGLPDFKPAVQNFVVDDRGYIWIQLSALEEASTVDWIVLDETGNRVGSLKLPAKLRLMDIRRGKAYGVLSADDGSDILIAYTIL